MTAIRSSDTRLRIEWLILAGLLLLGFGIRAYNAINDPYLGFDVRQFHSVVVAKGAFYNTDQFPEEIRSAAVTNADRQPYLEPRIMEDLSVLGYRLLGNDPLWVPALIASVFWIIGGIFVFLLGREAGSADAGLFATAVYLFLPRGVLDSNNFQPDPLMCALIVTTAYLIYRYMKVQTRTALVIAAICAALTIYVKLQAVIFVAPIFFFLSLGRVGLRKTLLSLDSYLFAFIALLPAFVFYFDGFFISRRMQGEEGGRFLPQLWFMVDYYRGWLRLINRSVGFVALVAGLLGILATSDRLYRSLLIGYWAGYLLLGIVFNYNIYTHLYYQLTLVPVIALSIASLGQMLMQHLRQVNTAPWSQVLVYGVLLLGVALAMLLVVSDEEDSVQADYAAKVQAAVEIGELIDHNVNTALLAESYGLPLTFYGDFSGYPWQNVDEQVAAALAGTAPKPIEEQLSSNRYVPNPEFFVITDFEDFDQQPALKAYLDDHYTVFAETPDYLIYDLRDSAQAPADS